VSKCNICGEAPVGKNSFSEGPFRAEDFFGVMGPDIRVHPTRAAERANTRLSKLTAALERAHKMMHEPGYGPGLIELARILAVWGEIRPKGNQ
jgi:hypothetical protein